MENSCCSYRYISADMQFYDLVSGQAVIFPVFSAQFISDWQKDIKHILISSTHPALGIQVTAFKS